MTTRIRRLSPDAVLVAVLVVLWLFFFWRLFTPIAGDQASLERGDFSGQFVAFAGYQYNRFVNGEVPLWNPYNNGGLPFIADTQAAVFYPPRLLTIVLARLFGGWSYHALELEMTAHVLAYSLMMYLLVRRLTLGQNGSYFGAFVAAVIAAYSGFMTGYAPLQLAIMEAGIWLPLAALGILEAFREPPVRWRWLLLTGFGLGVSWLAGHPQTSWFLTNLLVVYVAYHVYTRRYRWHVFVVGTALFGAVAFGVAAVQLLPGLEYLTHTARVDLTFEAKGNGFPFQDVIQFVFPNIVSLFSPLYVGIIGLVLAVLGFRWLAPRSLFWGIVAVGALLLSFGANTPIFDALYNTSPGLRFFRGQERAAYLVGASLAVLAGIGASQLVTWTHSRDSETRRKVQRGLRLLVIVCGIIFAFVFVAWLGNRDAYGAFIGPVALSTIIVVLTAIVIPYVLYVPEHQPRRWLLAALIVFELFTVTMFAPGTYDPVPPPTLTPPPLVERVLADDDGIYRVDGFRGLTDNYGSLYGVMDMRGISPLFLEEAFTLIEPEKINPLAWELFAVRYVFTDWNELPVPSEIVGTGEDRSGPINLHRLEDPRPFAHLVYDDEIIDSDEFARALLLDPNFNPRGTVILNQPHETFLGFDTGDRPLPLEGAFVNVTDFQPEQFTIQVETPFDGILSVAHPDYPGWRATVDGEPTPIFRAYGLLSAVFVPFGEHTVRFVYDPISYRYGAVLSLLTWAALAILGVWFAFKGRRMPKRPSDIDQRLSDLAPLR